MAKEITNDELARMIQEGFLEMKLQNEATNSKIDELRSDFEKHRTESRTDHADIRFKLSEAVSRVEHNQLTVRVETLETKAA